MEERALRAIFMERAYQILAGREHSSWELRQKLLRKGCPQDLAAELVAELRSLHYIDDVRFGGVLVRSKLGQGWGKQRILAELRARGVQGEALEAVLLENEEALLPECEEERAAEIVRRRLRSSADVDKVMRYLLAHGYSGACARRALEPYRQELD